MQIYLICFFISFLFMFYSAKLEKRKKKKYIVFEIIGISILSLLAALRADTVGYDMQIYIKPVFETFANYGFNLDYVNNIGIEFLYLMLNYVVALFTKEFSIYLFIMQFIIIFFSYEGIKKIKQENNTLMFIIFTFLFFNKSLNIARQSIALAFVLYSLRFIYKKNIKKFIFTILLTSLIHRTAIITLLLYPIYWLLKSNSKKITIVGIIIGCFLLIVFFEPLLSFLINANVLPDHFSSYLTIYQKDSLDFDMVELLLDIFVLFIAILFSKPLKKNDNYNFYLILLVIDIISIIIGGNINFVSRIGLYFKVPSLIYFLSSFNTFVKEKNNIHFISNIFVFMLMIAYWIYIFGFRNIGNTLPYIFR